MNNWRWLPAVLLIAGMTACDMPGPRPPTAVNHVHSTPSSSAAAAAGTPSPAASSPSAQPSPVTAVTASPERCHTSTLSVGFTGSEGAAGTIVDTFRMTNSGRSACTLFGFVGLLMLDGGGRALPTRVVRNGGILATQAGPSRFLLQPGASATFQAAWSDVPRGSEGPCPQAASLIVTPPDEYDHEVIPVRGWGLAPCAGGEIDVSPLRAAGAAS